MGRKPPALARELLRNFPKRRARNARRRRKGAKGAPNGSAPAGTVPNLVGAQDGHDAHDTQRTPDGDRVLDSLQRGVEDALDHAGE
jgi:hypothetical protein